MLLLPVVQMVVVVVVMMGRRADRWSQHHPLLVARRIAARCARRGTHGKGARALGHENPPPGIDEPIGDLADAQARHGAQPPFFVFCRVRVARVLQ